MLFLYFIFLFLRVQGAMSTEELWFILVPEGACLIKG